MVVILFTRNLWERRLLLALAMLLFVYFGYVILMGGDWMKLSRFAHPALPLMAILAQEGARSLVLQRLSSFSALRARNMLVMLVAIAVVLASAWTTRDNYWRDLNIALDEDAFWSRSAEPTGVFLARHAKPGATIAMGDIGEIGYRSHLEVIDILGLVTPYVSNLSGGYTRKDPSAVGRFVLDAEPEYILMITTSPVLDNAPMPHHASAVFISEADSFRTSYRTFFEVQVTGAPHYWVVMRHRDKAPVDVLDPGIDSSFETETLAGWHRTGEAFALTPSRNAEIASSMGLSGFEGEQCVASNGGATGRLTSGPFTLTERYVDFLLASGVRSDDLSVSLIVDGEVAYRTTAAGARRARAIRWDVSALRGHTAEIRIDDASKSERGSIAVDFLRQTNTRIAPKLRAK